MAWKKRWWHCVVGPDFFFGYGMLKGVFFFFFMLQDG